MLYAKPKNPVRIVIPNFPILNRGKYSFEFIHRGIRDYHAAIDYIHRLPYGRPSIKRKLELVLIEQKGSCSTKHALLVELARENRQPGPQLQLGIYQMSEANTTGIQGVLDKYGLNFIPEAHCYLTFSGQRYDFTTYESPAIQSPFESLMEEVEINPSQITEFKKSYHRNFLHNWLKGANLQGRWNLDKVWNVREECIKKLAGIKDFVEVS